MRYGRVMPGSGIWSTTFVSEVEFVRTPVAPTSGDTIFVNNDKLFCGIYNQQKRPACHNNFGISASYLLSMTY